MKTSPHSNVRWCLLKSIMSFMTNQFKNRISLITIPVPIVCVFHGCVISSCWYFAQALLRIHITACFRSLFFVRYIFNVRWRLPPPCFVISATERPWEEVWIDPFLRGWGWAGITWFLGEQNGASFVIGNPKTKSLKKNWGIEFRGTTQNCWTIPVWEHIK